MKALTPSAMLPLIVCLWIPPLGQAYKMVDLSHAQSPRTSYWPAMPEQPGWERTIVASQKISPNTVFEVGSYSSGEHGGTHVDVPRHFFPTGLDLKDFPLERTVAEGVVIDCTAEAEADYDYGVTKEKLKQWEVEHGRIPDEAAVLFKFGYASKFWDPEKYFNTLNITDSGTYHFPYLTFGAVQWLLDARDPKMVGMDVASPDTPGDPNFSAHIALLKRNVLIMENVNIRASLPPRDFRLHAASIRVENGTGVQTRIYAMLHMRGAGDVCAGLSSHSQRFWSLLAWLLLLVANILTD